MIPMPFASSIFRSIRLSQITTQSELRMDLLNTVFDITHEGGLEGRRKIAHTALNVS